MEFNKENTNRSNQKLQSKIPLPLEPLPGIKRGLLKKHNFGNERRPLMTLLDQASNLPRWDIKKEIKKDGKKKIKLRKSKSLTPNSRPVMHSKIDNFRYKVYKEDEGSNSVICISDDEVEVAEIIREHNTEYLDDKRMKNCLRQRETNMAVTPAVNTPEEQNYAKNIKDRLKIYQNTDSFHNKLHKLQVPSSTARVSRRLAEDIHKKRLKFNRRLELVKSPDLFKTTDTDSLVPDYGCETIAYLVEKEAKWPKHSTILSATRACILNWLLRVNGVSGNPATIHTATWYLDSVLALGSVPIHELQLMGSACYWIAQKINGPATSAQKLVKCSKHAFESEYLLKAEFLILKKLKLPQLPVVPQEFISFLAWWCDNDDFKVIELAATFICMSGLILDMGLLDEYPSVIGAAAVRNALALLRKYELLEKLEMCPVFESIEKKSNLYEACSIQRKAILTLASPMFEYKAPLELYSIGLDNIPEKIVREVQHISVVDARARTPQYITFPN